MTKKVGKRLAIIFSVILLIISVAFVLIFSHQIIGTTKKSKNGETRKYYVIVCGDGKNPDSLDLFYAGASSISLNYNSVVEYLLPQSYENANQLEENLNYAKYVCADGVLLFSEDENYIIPEIKNIYGSKIPVIAAGIFSEDSNYSDQIKSKPTMIASEIGYFTNNNIGFNNIAVLVRENQNPKYNEQFLQALKKYGNFFPVFFKSSSTGDDEIRNLIVDLVKNNKADTIVCINDEDTEKVCEILVDLNYAGKLKVIGVAENQICSEFEQKGIISKLVNRNSFNKGAEAITKLFTIINEEGGFYETRN